MIHWCLRKTDNDEIVHLILKLSLHYLGKCQSLITSTFRPKINQQNPPRCRSWSLPMHCNRS